MVGVDEASIARLKIGGTNLEILVDSESAIRMKEGEDLDIRDILASDKIFFDAKKGMLASTSKIKEIFDTDDTYEIAKRIILEGDVQLTKDLKNKKLEEKKKRILQIIRQNSIDPKTGSPIPESRIQLAFEEANIRIDEHKKEEEQVDKIVRKLRTILPIKFERSDVQIVVPANFAAKGYPLVASIGSIKKEEWLDDGSWKCIVEIPAGLRMDLMDRLNSLTHGEAEIKILDK